MIWKKNLLQTIVKTYEHDGPTKKLGLNLLSTTEKILHHAAVFLYNKNSFSLCCVHNRPSPMTAAL